MWSHEGIQFQEELVSLMVSFWGYDKRFQRAAKCDATMQ